MGRPQVTRGVTGQNDLCLCAFFFPEIQDAAKGGVVWRGVCRHTKTAKNRQNHQNRQHHQWSRWVCCQACFSRANVCCHCGWQETAQTAKTVKTAKTVNATHPLDHTPPLQRLEKCFPRCWHRSLHDAAAKQQSLLTFHELWTNSLAPKRGFAHVTAVAVSVFPSFLPSMRSWEQKK